MWIFYALALIPLAPAGYLWYTNKQIVWWEWLIGCLASFVLAGIFHLVVIKGMTNDTETWSGQLVETIHHPMWVEEYQVPVYRTEPYTDSKGNIQTRQVFSHYETHYRTHPQHWTVECTVNGQEEVDHDFHHEIVKNFGGRVKTVNGHKSGFYSGDPNIYVTENETQFVYPTTASRSFENRIKAAPSVYSYVKVPENVPVFDYPENSNIYQSDRLLGTAGQTIDIREFDILNSQLGPAKKVNLILVGFGQQADFSLARMQEAKWVGGKKNDLVVCYGGGTLLRPSWAYCFSWSEKELVKKNLETLILNHSVDNHILPLIRSEIVQNFEIKDWKKWDYISIEPPFWSYIVFFVFLLVSQGLLFYYFHKNEFSAGGKLSWRCR